MYLVLMSHISNYIRKTEGFMHGKNTYKATNSVFQKGIVVAGEGIL